MSGDDGLKKYKYGFQIYLSVFVMTIISLPILFMGDLRNMFYIFSLPALIFEYLYLINIAFFTYKSVNNKGILTKTIFSSNSIEWDEIYGVYFEGNNKLNKYIVIIRGKDKKTTITNWYKNSEELLKIVVHECKKRNIKVDLMVEKIIKD